MEGEEEGVVPPMRSVRLAAGRDRFMFWSPSEPSGNLKLRFFTSISGPCSRATPFKWAPLEVILRLVPSRVALSAAT